MKAFFLYFYFLKIFYTKRNQWPESTKFYSSLSRNHYPFHFAVVSIFEG